MHDGVQCAPLLHSVEGAALEAYTPGINLPGALEGRLFADESSNIFTIRRPIECIGSHMAMRMRVWGDDTAMYSMHDTRTCHAIDHIMGPLDTHAHIKCIRPRDPVA